MHRFRKMFGGAMRQVGIIAAGALYALEHHIERLAEDHANARRLAEAIAEMPGLTIDLDSVETNILYFDVASTLGTGKSFSEKLKERGVLALATAPQRIRAVTHLDVSAADIERAIAILQELTGAKAKVAARSA